MSVRTEHPVTYQNGLFTIQPARITLREAFIIAVVLAFVPLASIALLTTWQVLTVTSLWVAAIGHLSVGRMRLQSYVTVDLGQKLIHIEPLYPVLFRHDKIVHFSSVESFNLAPIIVGGRYSPLGRRMRLVLKDKSRVTLFDYTNYADAQDIRRILTAIVHPSNLALKTVVFKGGEILVLEVVIDDTNYIVYQSLLDTDVYFIDIVANEGSSLYSVLKLLKKSDAIKLLTESKEEKSRIVDSYR